MSFFTERDRDECWTYFDRHIQEIPSAPNAGKVREYLQEREENIEVSTVGSYLTHLKASDQDLTGTRGRQPP